MSLSVLTPARSSRLISLEAVKGVLGITGSAYDAQLDLYVAGVSSDLNLELARTPDAHLGRQRYREGIAGTDRSRIHLSRWPVDADSISITVDGVAVTDWTFEAKSFLFRRTGWGTSCTRPGDDPEETVVVTYKGGYLLPEMIADWLDAAEISAGAWTRPSDRSATPYLFEATEGGETDDTEPDWSVPAAGETVADGSVTWTARSACELPEIVSQLALIASKEAWTRRGRSADLTSFSGPEGISQSFAPSVAAQGTALPVEILAAAKRLRWQI